jgi:hypothetical protein
MLTGNPLLERTQEQIATALLAAGRKPALTAANYISIFEGITT